VYAFPSTPSRAGIVLYATAAAYCGFVFVAWAWLADPQVDVSEFLTTADCVHSRMFSIRRRVIPRASSRQSKFFTLCTGSSLCVLFIVIPGLVFLGIGLWYSDIQFLRLSDCDIDSSSHVAVVLLQTCPGLGALPEVKKEQKFVQKLLRGNGWASFDLFGVRYVQVTDWLLHNFRLSCYSARMTRATQLPHGSSRLFSCLADQLIVGSSLARLQGYFHSGKHAPSTSSSCV
jgi:hypothetical protein